MINLSRRDNVQGRQGLQAAKSTLKTRQHFLSYAN